MKGDTFKQCPVCGTWFTLDNIIHSPEIEPIGMTLDPANDDNCFLYFTHSAPECMTTFVIPVEDLRPALDEELTAPRVHPGEGCSGHCTTIADLSACRQNCELAVYRRFMLKLMSNRELLPQSYVDSVLP